MRIAIASDNGTVSGHFGHCQGFTMYEVKENKISNKVFLENPGHRPGYLPVFLKEKGTDLIIAGGMGATAQTLFEENGIEVIVGAQGDLNMVVQNYLSGILKSSGSVCTEHAHEGNCGE